MLRPILYRTLLPYLACASQGPTYRWVQLANEVLLSWDKNQDEGYGGNVSLHTQKTQNTSPMVHMFVEHSGDVKEVDARQIPFTNTIPESVKNGVEVADDVSKSVMATDLPDCTEKINLSLYLLILSVIIVVLLSWLVETYRPDLAPPDGHPRLWLFALLLASNTILVPGLLADLLSFSVALEVGVVRVPMIRKKEDPNAPITESMLSLMTTLWDTGCCAGVALLFFYAVVIPAVKLSLFAFGEYYRHSVDDLKRKAGRRAIMTVQSISKWGCPDMFAYIVMWHLFTFIDEASDSVSSKAYLGTGFACFAVFCVCSTISSLAIEFPLNSHELEDPVMPFVVVVAGKQNVVWVTVGLTLIFGVLMFAGLTLPCIGLQILTDNLLEPEGPVPRVFESALKVAVGKSESQVGVVQCASAMLLNTIRSGQAVTMLAFIMLSLFVVTLTILDMVALLAASLQLRKGLYDKRDTITARIETVTVDMLPQRPSEHSIQKIPSGTTIAAIYKPTNAMAVARVLGHLSMLDVFVVGVLVTIVAGANYKSDGFILMAKPGLWALAGAEVFHYVTYYVVSSAVKFAVLQSERGT